MIPLVSIFEPNLELLRQFFGNDVQDCHVELIRVVLGWRHVYRVTLSRQGHSACESIIIKTLGPDGPASLLEGERELRFYQTLYPQLSIPKPEVYHLMTDEMTGFHVIVMEDLALTHHLPDYLHQWWREELSCVLRTYAYLHTHTFESLNYTWLAPRHESQLNIEMIPEQIATVQRAGIWGDLFNHSELLAYACESSKRYADEKVCLIHGDTTPTNAFLPKSIDQLATLIDWIDVGVGMPEFDLAYMDLQPFESARLIPRSELLDIYWQFRAEIDSRQVPSPKERRARQLHADLVTALWLTGTASRVALHPFPEGTYPHMHWSSQFGIVYNRLKSMAEEIY